MTAANEKIAKALRLIDLLADLPDPFIETLTRFSMIRQIRAGETIFCQGEPSPYCFGIVSGQVTIQRVPKDKNFAPKILSLLGPGSMFGEQSLFKDSPRTAMALASQNGELVAIQGKQFRDWIEKDPKDGVPLLMGVLQSTISRLRQTSHELSLVYGAGRLLAAEKPVEDRCKDTADFLRASLEGIDEITIFKKNPFWEEYTPVVTVPHGSTAPLPNDNPLVQQLSAVLRPIVPEVEKADGSSVTALVPFLNPGDPKNPLLGFIQATSRSNPRAFSPGILLLLETVSVQFTEALLRQQQQEDLEAKARLQQSRQTYKA
jgi:CRP/FNR family cyclic AMP-dependent transcriptional regulator